MFNSITNIVSVRMFDVRIRYCANMNINISNKMIQADIGLYKALCNATGIKVGDPIEFFTQGKEYPVLEHMYKSSMEAVGGGKSRIALSRGSTPEYQYSEQTYLVIPDNMGYIRYIGMHDVAVTRIEVPRGGQKRKVELSVEFDDHVMPNMKMVAVPSDSTVESGLSVTDGQDKPEA